MQKPRDETVPAADGIENLHLGRDCPVHPIPGADDRPVAAQGNRDHLNPKFIQLKNCVCDIFLADEFSANQG